MEQTVNILGLRTIEEIAVETGYDMKTIRRHTENFCTRHIRRVTKEEAKALVEAGRLKRANTNTLVFTRDGVTRIKKKLGQKPKANETNMSLESIDTLKEEIKQIIDEAISDQVTAFEKYQEMIKEKDSIITAKDTLLIEAYKNINVRDEEINNLRNLVNVLECRIMNLKNRLGIF